MNGGPDAHAVVFLSISDAVARYGAIAIGLVLGTMARYGLALIDGVKLTWRAFLGDMLLLGILGLSAVVALSSDRIVRMVRKWTERRAEIELDRDAPPRPIPEAPPAVRQIIGELLGNPLPASEPEHSALIAKLDKENP